MCGRGVVELLWPRWGVVEAWRHCWGCGSGVVEV